MRKEVILVDENDIEIGREEKMQAHIDGKLHRAFSIFIVNSKDEILLQKRAKNKYHSAGLWTNTCCSHPEPGEDLNEVIYKRLMEEMGFHCDLKWAFSYLYRAEFENGLTEHEFDHVYIGIFEGVPQPNASEVEDWRWINIEELRQNIKDNYHEYTYWFRQMYDQFYQNYRSRGEVD